MSVRMIDEHYGNAAICREPGRDFTKGSDAKLVDESFEEVIHALAEVARLAGLSKDETERRVRLLRELHSSA